MIDLVPFRTFTIPQTRNWLSTFFISIFTSFSRPETQQLHYINHFGWIQSIDQSNEKSDRTYLDTHQKTEIPLLTLSKHVHVIKVQMVFWIGYCMPDYLFLFCNWDVKLCIKYVVLCSQSKLADVTKKTMEPLDLDLSWWTSLFGMQCGKFKYILIGKRFFDQ